MSLRILCVSNSVWTGTGYGTQIAQLIEHLRRMGHQVALFANYGLAGGKIEMGDGLRVYPAALDPAGNDMIHGHADHWNADLVIVLYDAFAMNGHIIRQMSQLVCFWQPVDCQPMSRADLHQFNIGGAQPIAMSKFGRQMMVDEGLDPYYAPHGIDTQKIFTPVSEAERSALRAIDDGRMKPIPEDAFVIGSCVHNKDAERKSIFEAMSAFALFRRKHKDALYMVHTLPHPVMSGNDIIGMSDFLGITPYVRWADPYSLLGGEYTQEDMAKWYRKLNLYAMPSRGEGFGLPGMEAQACGIPVVATDCSAMTELVGPGWLVGGQPRWQPGHQSTWITPDIGELLAAYKDAYNGGAAARAGEAREFAEGYDADLVFDRYWVPILDELEHLITDEPESVARERWQLIK